jgi:glutamate N-acetyltransferase / amino-acid N-acetyltransferase
MLPHSRFAVLPAYVQQAERSVTSPQGFAAAGVATGVKKRGKLDLGILASTQPCVAAATFTQNAAAAAPVRLTRETGDCDHVRAVVVNAGNANACTGKQGLADAARMRLLAAQELRLPVELVAVASTGIIGQPLPMERIEPGILEAARHVRPGGGEHFAQAIRTTDRTPKRGALEIETPDGVVRLGVAAKGCGMISPNMATMLCFVTCDAAVPVAAWRAMVKDAVDATFNRITVDGQESTNDMVLALANGASSVAPGDEGLGRIAEGLRSSLLAIALAMVADGEGATKTVRLDVTGASDAAQAERVARAVAGSPLVKTAFYGRDANWGRIVQAVGQALGGRGLATLPVDVSYDDLVVVGGGEPAALGEGAQERLADIMTRPEISLHVGLNGAGAQSTVYFSDLTHDYVTLNAEYTT